MINWIWWLFSFCRNRCRSFRIAIDHRFSNKTTTFICDQLMWNVKQNFNRQIEKYFLNEKIARRLWINLNYICREFVATRRSDKWWTMNNKMFLLIKSKQRRFEIEKNQKLTWMNIKYVTKCIDDNYAFVLNEILSNVEFFRVEMNDVRKKNDENSTHSRKLNESRRIVNTKDFSHFVWETKRKK